MRGLNCSFYGKILELIKNIENFGLVNIFHKINISIASISSVVMSAYFIIVLDQNFNEIRRLNYWFYGKIQELIKNIEYLGSVNIFSKIAISIISISSIVNFAVFF